MDHVSNLQRESADDSLTSRCFARGYRHDDLAIATGLTVSKITAAEDGGGQKTTSSVSKVCSDK